MAGNKTDQLGPHGEPVRRGAESEPVCCLSYAPCSSGWGVGVGGRAPMPRKVSPFPGRKAEVELSLLTDVAEACPHSPPSCPLAVTELLVHRGPIQLAGGPNHLGSPIPHQLDTGVWCLKPFVP